MRTARNWATWRKFVMIGVCGVVLYFVLSALLPEYMITAIHIGKQTYHPDLRLF